MKTNPNPSNHEEELTRFIEGETNQALHPDWSAEKEKANQLGELLRMHLPSRLEPPSPDFFTHQIMERIQQESLPQPQKVAWVERFRIWLAPLATATALLVVGGIVLQQKTAPVRDSFAYTPMPNVTATLDFNSDAEATVINLDGLDAIPDTQEIKAFNVVSSNSAGPGAPQQFFAANDPSKLVFVLFSGDSQAPKIHVVQ